MSTSQPTHKQIIAFAIAGVGSAYYLYQQRNIISRRLRAKALSRHFQKYSQECEEAIFLALGLFMFITVSSLGRFIDIVIYRIYMIVC